MKKSAHYLFLVLIAIGLFSSCTTPIIHRLVVDEFSPPDQSAVVTFINHDEDGWFIIKAWNNVDIRRDLYSQTQGTVRGMDRAIITLPAGNHTFLFDYGVTRSTAMGTTEYRYDNLRMQFVFQAGREYEIKGRTSSLGLFSGREAFICVYDVTNRSELIMERKIGEY